MVEGEAGTESALYSQSGGCYTHENVAVKTCNPRKVKVDDHYWICSVNGCTGTVHQERYDGQGDCGGNHGSTKPYSCDTCGRAGDNGTSLNLTSHDYHAKTYSLNCTVGAICAFGTNWGDNDIYAGQKEVVTASTGGSCYYNPSLVMSATFSAGNKVTEGTLYTSSNNHLSIENVRCKENQSKNASYSFTLKLRVVSSGTYRII